MSTISVVIPTYNRAHILKKVIDSAVNQSLKPSEIIVVDDGSTDSTNEVVRKLIDDYKDIGIRYIFQENQGGNVARNCGIQKAQGEYIAFLDSDDLWDREKLEKQMKVFSENSHLGAVYCGLRHIHLDNGNVINEPRRLYPSGDLSQTLLIRDLTAPTSCYMVKRKVFEQLGGFDIQLKARQDWEMWIRIAQKFEIGVVPEALVNYGEHSGVRTATNPQKEIDAYRYIRKKYNMARRNLGVIQQLEALSAYYRRMGKVYRNYKHNGITATIWFLKALLVWPFSVGNWFSILGLFFNKNTRIILLKYWNELFQKSKIVINNH